MYSVINFKNIAVEYTRIIGERNGEVYGKGGSFMKKHVQTDSEWQEEMSQKIIDEIQCELYLDMPFMKLALSALSPKVNEQLYSMATDGTYIYYNPIRLIDIFKKNGMYLNRAYLHSVLHCLFFHLWTKGERDEFLWNTACDIMVEYTIDTMEKKSTKRILSYIRKTTYERLKKEHIVIAPGALYAWLYKQYAEIKAEEITDIDDIANTKDKNELALLAREFYTDDHALWPEEKNDNAMPLSSSEAQKQWQKISRQTRMEKKHSKDSESEGEQVMMRELSAKRSRRSYKEFCAGLQCFVRRYMQIMIPLIWGITRMDFRFTAICRSLSLLKRGRHTR